KSAGSANADAANRRESAKEGVKRVFMELVADAKQRRCHVPARSAVWHAKYWSIADWGFAYHSIRSPSSVHFRKLIRQTEAASRGESARSRHALSRAATYFRRN